MDYRQLSREVFGLPGHPLDEYTMSSLQTQQCNGRGLEMLPLFGGHVTVVLLLLEQSRIVRPYHD